MTDLERLRAENARLKTALLHIKDGRGYCSFCGEIASGPMGGVLSCDCSAAGYHWEHDPVKIARAALSADPAPVATITLYAMPPENAPKGCPVLVAGGIAMRKTGGEWFSGMCEPAFSRRLEWEPKWWAAIPQQNDAIAGENGND